MKKFSKMDLEKAKQTFGLTSWPVDEASLKKQYRLLSFKHHPDRGGEKAEMQAVNEAAEILFEELEKGGKSEKGTWTKLHDDVDKAMSGYKDIDHSDADNAAEVMHMEETHKVLKEKGHVELAKLDSSGIARVKVALKSGGEITIKVWKDKPSRYQKTKYYGEIESVSDGVDKEKYQVGTRISDNLAITYYDRAEKYRNYETKIREKKKSLSRQKKFEETFEVKEHGLGGTAYYTTEPSESIASDLIGYLLQTTILKKLSKGPNAGKLTMHPGAIDDLAKSKDMNAKFIAGVGMFMRGLVDKKVTSNSMAMMDASHAAEQIAASIIFGSADGIKEYEKEKKISAVPGYEKNLKEHEGKDAEQVAKEEYEKEYNKTLNEYMQEMKTRIDQLRRSPQTHFKYDNNTSASREERIANEEKIMTENAKKMAERMARSHSDYRKKDFEDSKEHREKGVYRYNEQGNHSDVFKKEHGEFLEKKEKVDTQKKEILNRMNSYAKTIAKVMLDKGLMEAHPDMKYRTSLKIRLVRLAHVLDSKNLLAEADLLDEIISRF